MLRRFSASFAFIALLAGVSPASACPGSKASDNADGIPNLSASAKADKKAESPLKSLTFCGDFAEDEETVKPGGEFIFRNLRFTDIYTFPTLGESTTGAAFLTIRNLGDTPETLIGAGSDSAKRVEIHTHVMRDDIMHMEKLDSLTIPAQGSVTLKPGGLHLMLFEMPTPLKAGDAPGFTLDFGKSGKTSVTGRVKARELPQADAPAEHPHGHHEHHHH